MGMKALVVDDNENNLMLAKDLLELCFTLIDHAKIMPYYFYMCDMIPFAEHWRLSPFW